MLVAKVAGPITVHALDRCGSQSGNYFSFSPLSRGLLFFHALLEKVFNSVFCPVLVPLLVTKKRNPDSCENRVKSLSSIRTYPGLDIHFKESLSNDPNDVSFLGRIVANIFAKGLLLGSPSLKAGARTAKNEEPTSIKVVLWNCNKRIGKIVEVPACVVVDRKQ